MLTPKECEFWETELDCFEAAVRTGEIDARTTRIEAESVNTQNTMISLALVILGFASTLALCAFVAITIVRFTE
jgi:hypothetical protein